MYFFIQMLNNISNILIDRTHQSVNKAHPRIQLGEQFRTLDYFRENSLPHCLDQKCIQSHMPVLESVHLRIFNWYGLQSRDRARDQTE